MIAQTVEELTPIIGTRPACRALGAAPATIYRRRRPAGAAAAAAAAGARAGAHRGRARRRCWPSCCTRAVRRQLARAGVGDAARRGPLPGVRAHDVPAAGRRARRGARAARPAHAPRLRKRRSCSPSARTRCGRWDITKLKGPAKWTYFYLYVILDVFSRYAVGWTVQHRESGQLAKALIAQAAEQQQIAPRPADRARRPRQLDDAPSRSRSCSPISASRKSHSRPYTSTDNPYSRGAVQDAQVPARVPRAVRHASSTPAASAASSSTGTTTTTATPGSA